MNPVNLQVIREFADRGDYGLIASHFSDSHPATIAEVLEELVPDQALDVLRHLESELRADVFTHMDE